MNAIRSSVNTSKRCAGNSFKNHSHREQGDLSDCFQTALAFSTMTIIGPAILMLINEIYQTLFNEPIKREEQLEMACHVAFEKIKPSDNGAEPRSLEFKISNGNEIKYTEQADGVHVQHDGGKSKKILSKSGNPFNTLDELQTFRRKDISENKIEYENIFTTPALEEAFRKASLSSILSTINIDANTSCLDTGTIGELKNIYKLNVQEIEQAIKSIQDALINQTDTAQVYTGLDVLRLATKPLFAIEKNWRYDQDSESSFVTSRRIYNLTNAGEEKIAAYYNKKYFQSGKNGQKIIVTENDEDFKNKLSLAISDKSCKMAGFLFRVNPHPDAHPTPIVFEKKNGELHFFISDSMAFSQSQYRAITDTLQGFPEAKVKIHISSASTSSISRQADNGSCHSDALYYLQRALRLGSMCEQVTIVAASDPSCEYDVFDEPADLLLTAQTSKVLGINNIKVKSKLKLGKPGMPKTFGDKTVKYNDDVEYSGMEDTAEKKKFKTKGFLSHVNQKHHSILMIDDYV